MAGFVALRELGVEQGARLLSRMLDALGERGPDDARNTVVSKDFGLAVKRPRGSEGQPWRSPRGDFVAGWDGVPVLTQDGDAVGTGLHSLRARYEDAVMGQVGGPCVVALWDGRSRAVFLGRDLFGERSLMTAWSKDRTLFLFASEAKALLATQRIPPVLDGRAVLDLFSIGHPVGSVVDGVEVLAPGTWMTVDVRGQVRRGRSQRPPYPRTGEPRPTRTRAEELGQALDAALSRSAGVRAAVVVGEGPASALLASRLSEGRALTAFVGALEGDPQGAADFAERMAETLEASLAAVPLRSPERADFVRCLHALESATLDAEPYFRAQLYAGLRADGRDAVILPVGAEALFGGRAARAPGPSLWSRAWRGSLARWALGDAELARALRRGFALDRSLRRRWGAAPVHPERWTMAAQVADRLFARRFRPPAGPSRLPELKGPPLLLARSPHRRDRVYQGLYLAARDLAREERLASRAGVRPVAPFLSPEVSVLASGGGSGTQLDLVRAALPAHLSRARRRSEHRFRRPHPDWPFGPGVPDWVRDALAPRALERLGLFEGEAVGAALERLRVPGGAGGARRWEVRVLTGVLGLTLMSESLGLTDVAWPTTPS
ncbi:MAG: asparagine synthase-related protein [Myxococcota bacterium]